MEPLRSSQLVLVADDDPVNLQVLRSALFCEQLKLAVASDGQMALKMVASEPPDLILLDVQMPSLDGFEICRCLKSNSATRDIPVIFTTSSNEPGHRIRGLSLGAVDCISKPFEQAELLARVRTHLALRSMTRTLQAQNLRLEQQTLDLEQQLRRIAALQKSLEHEKEELIKVNQELVRSREQTAEVFEVMSELLPGQIIDGKYRIEARLGSGGCGVVYRATQVSLERPVALKVLCPHSELSIKEHLSYFRTEGIWKSRVTHPNAVVVFDANMIGGVAYLAMELLAGHTLGAELSRSHCMSLERCSQIIIPVCEVLAYAHSIGVVHCDIKPGKAARGRTHRERGYADERRTSCGRPARAPPTDAGPVEERINLRKSVPILGKTDIRRHAEELLSGGPALRRGFLDSWAKQRSAAQAGTWGQGAGAGCGA